MAMELIRRGPSKDGLFVGYGSTFANITIGF